MIFLASLKEMNTPANGHYVLTTLSVALLFAAIFLFGGRAAYQPGQRGRTAVPSPWLPASRWATLSYTCCPP